MTERKNPIQIKFILTPEGHACVIEVDGKDISAHVQTVLVQADVRSKTMVLLVLNDVGIHIEGATEDVGIYQPLEEKVADLLMTRLDETTFPLREGSKVPGFRPDAGIVYRKGKPTLEEISLVSDGPDTIPPHLVNKIEIPTRLFCSRCWCPAPACKCPLDKRRWEPRPFGPVSENEMREARALLQGRDSAMSGESSQMALRRQLETEEARSILLRYEGATMPGEPASIYLQSKLLEPGQARTDEELYRMVEAELERRLREPSQIKDKPLPDAVCHACGWPIGACTCGP